jgi:precorrin-2 dehydrogenase
MSYYPVLLQLEGKSALVVGGGGVAQRKVEALLDCGAKISIVSRELTESLASMVDAGKINLLGDRFHERQLENAFVVIAATDDEDLNREISQKARERGLLINAVDQPEDCNFIVPSIVRKGDLIIAISTSGKSPALAKKVRKDLDRRFGPEYEQFLVLMGLLRTEVLARGLSQSENSRIFGQVVDSGILKALSEGDWDEAQAGLRRIFMDDPALEDILEKWLSAVRA